ncbi:SERTA domain-containing protein 3-like [Antennarius striatus]|uniref:SERTA domain-containing protein 3-like n=1 Tax=Antennarius striatus TaxID=241820 RepID=UPI0035B43ADD
MTRWNDTCMLGRGVKRRRSYVEELEGGGVPAANKKKSAMEGPGGGGALAQQRQRVLGLCLEKLQPYCGGAGLSLRRSVLLVNTLRQLQEDMQSDPPRLLLTCPGCAEAPPPQERPAPPDQQRAPPATGVFSDGDPPLGDLSDLALDDVFRDIDTSMYDTLDTPPLWAAASLWPIVSLWADEDVRVGGLPSRLMDLNELDHILEVLVQA